MTGQNLRMHLANLRGVHTERLDCTVPFIKYQYEKIKVQETDRRFEIHGGRMK
jgi:hypothetical protein